jgi:hypothetical protein
MIPAAMAAVVSSTVPPARAAVAAMSTTSGAATATAVIATGRAAATLAAVSAAPTMPAVPAVVTPTSRRPAAARATAAALRIPALQSGQLELDRYSALVRSAGLDHLIADRPSQRDLRLGLAIGPGRGNPRGDRAVGVDEPEHNVHAGYRTAFPIHRPHDQRLGDGLADGGPLPVAGQRFQAGNGTVARCDDALAAGEESKEQCRAREPRLYRGVAFSAHRSVLRESDRRYRATRVRR